MFMFIAQKKGRLITIETVMHGMVSMIVSKSEVVKEFYSISNFYQARKFHSIVSIRQRCQESENKNMTTELGEF